MNTKRIFVCTLATVCLGVMLYGCSGGSDMDVQATAAKSNLSPQENIFKAAGAGDVATLKSLLAADGSLANVRGFNGMTPLHAAAMDGQTEAVKVLLAQGADPSVIDDNSSTPANTAMAEGHKDTAAVLNEAMNNGTPAKQ